MSKQMRKKNKSKGKNSLFGTVLLAVLLIGVLVIIAFAVFDGNSQKDGKIKRNGGLAQTVVKESFDSRMNKLEKLAFESDGVKNIYSPNTALDPDNAYTVFVSVCNGKSRAKVVHASASQLKQAWTDAKEKAQEFVKDNRYNVIWLKADIVDSMQTTTISDFSSAVRTGFNQFYRKGIATDASFKTALLEAELNGNDIIDYEDTHSISIKQLNNYLSSSGEKNIFAFPNELVTFTCLGFICDENGDVYALKGYGDDGLNYGRRTVIQDKNFLKDMVLHGANWLKNEMQANGEFVYGYYPINDRRLTNYNILRHITGVLPLIWDYDITNDKTMKSAAKKSFEYATKQIVHKSKDVAYIKDEKNREIKLGASGLYIIAADEYMNAFGKDKKIIENLKSIGNGIMRLQNSDGSFYHVLNMDFSKKEESRTVYYDGEATYGLCILYNLTNDEKWLDAAKKSAENFINNDYTQYRDHWVAYAMNEITKYCDDPRYYEFGLKNIQNNLNTIYNQKTTYHTYTELIMAGFEMYDRMKTQNINCDYLAQFDEDLFIKTIQKRIDYMLNGFLYPEYAMYLKNPEAVVYTFCVRHDKYRIRIDDVDHFVAGYNHYYRLYDEVQKYIKN